MVSPGHESRSRRICPQPTAAPARRERRACASRPIGQPHGGAIRATSTRWSLALLCTTYLCNVSALPPLPTPSPHSGELKELGRSLAMFDQEPAVSPAPLSTLFTYTYHSQRLRWGDARRSCQSMGLELATITSDQDHMAAVAASTATGANLQSEQAWIGLSDAVSEGWWHWSDGSSSAYRRWHSGEPNGGTGENCAMMSSVDWYDVGCNQQKPYLCAFSSSWPPFAPRPISPPPSAPAAALVHVHQRVGRLLDRRSGMHEQRAVSCDDF